jgi:hypothetical protein
MARCPIVRPETVRVTLADGEWLELAKELTAGEYRDMVSAQFQDMTAGETPSLNLKQVGMSRILAYVKDWSFVDFKDGPLPITEEWIRKFDQGTFAELLGAVNKHDDDIDKATEARKNDLATASK